MSNIVCGPAQDRPLRLADLAGKQSGLRNLNYEIVDAPMQLASFSVQKYKKRVVIKFFLVILWVKINFL